MQECISPEPVLSDPEPDGQCSVSALGSAITPRFHSGGNSELISLAAMGAGQLCF